MNRRHFIKAIALFATIPLLPPGKEWGHWLTWEEFTRGKLDIWTVFILHGDTAEMKVYDRENGGHVVFPMFKSHEEDYKETWSIDPKTKGQWRPGSLTVNL